MCSLLVSFTHTYLPQRQTPLNETHAGEEPVWQGFHKHYITRNLSRFYLALTFAPTLTDLPPKGPPPSK